MNLLNLLTLIAGFAGVAVILTLLSNKWNLYRNKVLLLLAIISGPMWAFSIVLFFEAQNLETALVYTKVIYTVSILTAIITFEFTRIFPYRDKFTWWQQILVIGFSFLLLYQLWFSEKFISSLYIVENVKTPVFGFYYTVWFLWFSWIIGWRIYVLFKKLRSITEIAKKQTTYMIVGISVAGLGMLPTNIILPTLGNYEYIWVGPFMSAIMVSVIAYGVSTLRFLNLKKLIIDFGKIFLYGLLPSFMLGFVVLKILGANSEIFLSFTLVIFFSLFPFVSFVIISRLKRAVLPKEILLKDKLSKKVEGELNLTKILQNFESICVKYLDLAGVTFLLVDENKRTKFKYEGKILLLPEETPILEFQSFANYYGDENKMIILQELRHLQLNSMEEQNIWRYKRFLSLINFLDRNNFHLVIPIALRNQMRGYLFLGGKKEKDVFNKVEIENLQKLRSTMKVILERSILYEEVESFNKTLQRKVNEQTQELKEKVRQLEQARRKESDMIDIMGHELRTPASIVKVNTDLLEKFVPNNPKEFKVHLDRIKSSIENEIKLINTLLSSAKLEGNKIEIHNEEIDVKAEINLILHVYEAEAKEKDLKIINNVNKNTPNIYADKVRTIEVLDNLIGNAVKYTHKGHVSVYTGYDEDYVKISISDTGKGIPKDEIPNLGQKFHRVGNYLESNKNIDMVRPGGTGLGLYVTFKLVELMKGKIWVESKEGEGSKFAFTLPVFRGVSETKKIKKSKNMFDLLQLKKK